MRKQEYKDILQNNGYINLVNVADFLEKNCIADYAVISEIFAKGMSVLDYSELQAAIEEILEEANKLSEI